jgi:hypothetical protein
MRIIGLLDDKLMQERDLFLTLFACMLCQLSSLTMPVFWSRTSFVLQYKARKCSLPIALWETLGATETKYVCVWLWISNLQATLQLKYSEVGIQPPGCWGLSRILVFWGSVCRLLEIPVVSSSWNERENIYVVWCLICCVMIMRDSAIWRIS